uniref:Uncharacterized protein n=1 Tax=Chrysemys picta bellii TaxID=8478 RepID=A0A8C3FA16_CHRPI
PHQARSPRARPPPPAKEPSGPSPPSGQEPSGPSPPPTQEPSVGAAPHQSQGPGSQSHAESRDWPMGRGGPLERLPLPTHPAHLCPGYAVRPIVPARRAELVAVAKAMHRDQFGREVQELFHLEREAALTAMQTGLYIGWRCPEYLWDCFRVGDLSKCFCGHLLREHQVYVGRFGAPDTVGQGWQGTRPKLTRLHLLGLSWEHSAYAPPCASHSCWCISFESNFLCAACDRRWEEHETFFETAETRRKGGRRGWRGLMTWHLPHPAVTGLLVSGQYI